RAPGDSGSARATLIIRHLLNNVALRQAGEIRIFGTAGPVGTMTVAAREDVGLAATGNDIGQRPVVARMPDRRYEPIPQLAPGITGGAVRHAHGPAIVDRGLMVRIIRRISPLRRGVAPPRR